MHTDYFINTDDLKDILQEIEDTLNERFSSEFQFEYNYAHESIKLYENNNLLMETSTFTIYEEISCKHSSILD